MIEDLSAEQMAMIGRIALFHTDAVTRDRMIAVANGEAVEQDVFKRLLYLGGPNDGWLLNG